MKCCLEYRVECWAKICNINFSIIWLLKEKKMEILNWCFEIRSAARRYPTIIFAAGILIKNQMAP